jgi:DNA-binding NarL/FixJ family response regulator
MARTVLIIDDHEGFRHLACALREADGFDVVGEAGDGESAMLPDINGFRAQAAAGAAERRSRA